MKFGPDNALSHFPGSAVPSITRSYLSPPTVELDLPPAHSLDETPANYLY